MKVQWTLDTDNPQDMVVLNTIHKIVQFTIPGEPTESKAETEPAETKPAETKPAETKPAETKPAEATSETKAPPKRKKRQPKEKTKEQLLALSLDDMIEYLKARTKFSLLDCRVLAKHYNDEFGDIDSVLDILHKLDANNFDDLKKVPEFLVATIKLIEAKRAEAEEAEEAETDADGFLGV
jgi:hypothetical protein